MEPYLKNSSCSCSRCRAGKLFGPAMIITVGVLFLLDQNGFMGLDRTWPVILLVAGLFPFLSRSASTEGHAQPYVAMPVPQPGMAQSTVAQPTVAQPAVAQSGMTPAQPPTSDASAGPANSTQNDTQVNP